jgi:hypothetical protein
VPQNSFNYYNFSLKSDCDVKDTILIIFVRSGAHEPPQLNAELLGCLLNTSRGSSNVSPAVAYTFWDYWKSFLDLVLLSWGYCTVCDDGLLKGNNIAACASCVDTLSHYLSAGGVLLVGSLFKRCVAVSCEDRCGLHRDHSGGRARECGNREGRGSSVSTGADIRPALPVAGIRRSTLLVRSRAPHSRSTLQRKAIGR